MSSAEPFKVHPRAQTGGGASRALRRSKMIPAILYGGEGENVSLSVDPRDVEKGLHQSGFYTKIFELDVSGKKEQALIRDIQFHPVTDQPIHMDFFRVNKDSKLHVEIPVHFVNEAQCPALKQGGVLNIVLHNLEIICTAGNIPSELTIDLTGLEMGAIIHIDALSLPKGVTIAHPERDNTLATLAAPRVAQEDVTPPAAEGLKEKSETPALEESKSSAEKE